jgi:hypothetical protein
MRVTCQTRNIECLCFLRDTDPTPGSSVSGSRQTASGVRETRQQPPARDTGLLEGYIRLNAIMLACGSALF